jgi:hypothetical protein
VTGTAGVLSAFIGRARSGIRADGLPLLAGHGMADPAYRPPRLPYASVVGPLAFELEPERDAPRAVMLRVQTPGHLGGAEVAGPVPAAGSLALRFDADVEATVGFDPGPLAGRPLPEAGPGVAATLEAAIRASDFGVTDPARLAELAAVTARWDAGRRRLVVASGRRGVLGPAEEARPSRVELLDPAGPVAAGLGLAAGAVSTPGQLVRHRRPAPTAVAIDIRVDLWAGSQRELAAIGDAWMRITATRGQVLERAALLAADVLPGDETVRLQPRGEAATRDTLLQLEPDPVPGTSEVRLADRLTGEPVQLAGGTVDVDGILVGPGSAASHAFFDPPPVPYAWLPDHPGTTGYAVSLRLRADLGAPGQVLRLLALEHTGTEVLSLHLGFVAVNGGATPQARLTGRATRAAGGVFAEAVGTVDAAALAAGVEVHLTVDAASGRVALFLDATPAPVPAGTVQAPAAPGLPAGGPGLFLVLGTPGSGAAPRARIGHVQVHGRPLGPLDQRTRRSTAPASDWAIGDPLSLARTEDGVTPASEPFAATVLAVEGDTLTLDRPVDAPYPRGRSVAFGRGLFFSQRQLRRHDDLMNQLYRLCIEYRVSTYLDERVPSVSAPLVETTDIEVRDDRRTSSRTGSGAPGTRPVVTDGPLALPGARHA